MKKLTFMLVFLIVLGSLSTVAFATEDVLSDASELTIGGNSTEIIIGLSPKVVARYINPGANDATAQWYSIATAHPGGNVKYGTAQNLNNVYRADFTTGTAINNTLLAIPSTQESASHWSESGWKL